MRILFVIDNFGPGGAERSLHELIPLFEAAGIECDVVALAATPHGEPAELARRSYRTHELAAGNGVARVRQLRSLITSLRPDIVHTSLFKSDVAGRAASWRTGAREVTSLVNTSYAPERLLDKNIRRSRFEAARAIDGWTGRHLTDHFHAITHAVKASAVDRLGLKPDRVTVIERGRDTERLGVPSAERRRHARERLGLGADDSVIVNVGRQDPQKNQVVLVDAFDWLSAEVENAVLVIAGREGHAATALAARVDASPNSARIHLLGHRDDVPDILAAADVFAFPSIYEGLGGSVIEAMALALPVVASDLPALREVVIEGATGTLVPAASADALANALRAVLEDPAHGRELGENGRRRFLEMFTLDRSARRMIEMYAGVLTGRGR